MRQNKSKQNVWVGEALNTVNSTKHLLSNLSVNVRTDQFQYFKSVTRPSPKKKILDVGVTSDETLKDSNIFERLYPYPKMLVAATVEDPKKFRKLYPNIKTVKVFPGKRLPFKDKSFDIVTAWATLEHVGGYADQEMFINELNRVGKKVFLTTPYRGCIYEPHTGLFFLHWMPIKFFRAVLRLLGKGFWSSYKHLNPLYISDISNMKLKDKFKKNIYKMFGLLPSHIIIHN